MTTTLRTLLAEHMEKLTFYVPIVKRVHGPTHPEFNDVAAEFKNIQAKITKETYDLKSEFTRLRLITNNYKIPHDVCETYAAVYEMLAQLDEAYMRG